MWDQDDTKKIRVSRKMAFRRVLPEILYFRRHFLYQFLQEGTRKSLRTNRNTKLQMEMQTTDWN